MVTLDGLMTALNNLTQRHDGLEERHQALEERVAALEGTLEELLGMASAHMSTVGFPGSPPRCELPAKFILPGQKVVDEESEFLPGRRSVRAGAMQPQDDAHVGGHGLIPF